MYNAFFHAISAFCNAGFSTFSDSLMGFAANRNINVIVAGLIILGGLGFGTLRNISSVSINKLRGKRAISFSVQTRLVLAMTVSLLFIGMALFWVLEYSNTLSKFTWHDQAMGAFFQSVTFRTAGFNTIDFGKVKEPTLMIGIVLMFIGAAPGSTGGGIKVTTLAILLGTVLSAARGRTRLELFHRTIPVMVLYQTLVVITLYLSLMLTVSFLLSLTEEQFRPIELLFETVSAPGNSRIKYRRDSPLNQCRQDLNYYHHVCGTCRSLYPRVSHRTAAAHRALSLSGRKGTNRMKKRFAVIGLGIFGRKVATSLAEMGAEVIAIDKNFELVDAIKEQVLMAVQLDGTNREALEAQGVKDVDAAIVGIAQTSKNVF